MSTLILPLFSTTFAYADPHSTGTATATTYTPQQAATSLSYYNVLLQCVGNNMKGTIYLNAADDGNATPASWFNDDTAQGTVFPDGKKDCKDIAPDALKLWGFSSNQDFLTALGYTYKVETTNGSTTYTWNGPGGNGFSNQRASQFQAAVGLKVYGQIYSGQHADPPVSDAAWYALYTHAFTSSDCKATDLGVYPTSNNTYNDLAKNNSSEDASSSTTIPGATGKITYVLLNVVNGAQKEQHAYAYNSSQTYTSNLETGQTDSSTTTSVLYGYRQASSWGANIKTCTDLANSINATVPGALAWNIAHPDQQIPLLGSTAPGNSSGDNKPTCTVEGVGWIVCPVMRLMANVVDAAYGFVASLLAVQPLMTTGATAGIYNAWTKMRSFANVAFVIAFIIIIYSQLTGAGINNYGIKKMLPRLIVAAILVNVSYWICAIVVDLSNILGSSMNGLLGGLVPANKLAATDPATNNGVLGWVGITGVVLGASITILYVGLSALIPAGIAALLAIVTVFLVLTLRQALIVLLVVISPLAFVAYLLPNTENLFKKWRELFQTLLLMYPIIAFIFGASSLASAIVMQGANGPYKIVIQIMGALISIIPLALTPVVMKSAGGVLNKFGGMVNNPNKGPFDRMRKGAENIRNRQQDRRAIRAMNGGNVFGGGQFRRKAKREAIDASLKRERSSLEQQHVAEEAVNAAGEATRFGRKLAGAGPMGGGADQAAIQRALANATFTIDEAVAKDIKAESVMVRDLDKGQLKNILSDDKASDTRKAAAMQRLVRVSDPIDYESEINDTINSDSSVLRRATAEALGSDGPGFIKASDVDRIASGAIKQENQANRAAGREETSLATIARDNTAAGVMSAEKIVNETNGSIQYAYDNSEDGPNGGKQRLVNASNEAQTNDQLKGKIKHNIAAIGALTNGAKHIARTAPVVYTKTNSSGVVTTTANSTYLDVS